MLHVLHSVNPVSVMDRLSVVWTTAALGFVVVVGVPMLVLLVVRDEGLLPFPGSECVLLLLCICVFSFSVGDDTSCRICKSLDMDDFFALSLDVCIPSSPSPSASLASSSWPASCVVTLVRNLRDRFLFLSRVGGDEGGDVFFSAVVASEFNTLLLLLDVDGAGTVLK